MRGSQSIRSGDKRVWTRGGGTCPQVREQVRARPVDEASHAMAAVPPRSKPTHCRGEWTEPAQTTWLLLLAWLWLAVSFPLANDAWAAYGNGNVPGGSPVGSPTVPPSSYQNGLTPNPNPIDNRGNLVMTGNVGGLKQFQGSMPYNSTTNFGAPLGSTRLDSFLRYSAIPQSAGDYPSAPGYEAFHSPTGTVTTIQPGQAAVSTPISPRLASGIGQWRTELPGDLMDSSQIGPARVPAGQDSLPDNWSAPRAPDQMSQITAGQAGRPFIESPALRQDNPSTLPAEYRQQLEQFRLELEKIKAQASQLEMSLAAGTSVPREVSPQPKQSGQAIESPVKTQGILPPATQTQTTIPSRPGDEPLTPAGQTPPSPQANTVTYTSAASEDVGRIAAIFRPQVPRATDSVATISPSPANGSIGLPAPQRAQTPAGAFQIPPVARTDMAGGTTNADQSGQTAITADITPDVETEVSAEATHQPVFDRAKPRYESLDAATREKFDAHMKAARSYQRQGLYNRAAESFALASVYAPGESRTYLGQSQALLAAGRYADSSLFLTKAIELDARQSLTKADLVDLVGGPDQFIQRFTDLQQRAEKTANAGDLHLLLAYIYQQMDRPVEAKAALEAAAQALPHSTAVALLQAAVNL